MPIFTHLWQPKKKSPRGPASRSKSLRVEQLEDRALLSLLGQSLFPADNPWNQRVDQAPVASNSAAIMSSIVGKYGDGRLHPDFGQDYRNSGPLYGIPYNVVHGNGVTKVHVVIDAYPSESDLKDAPIPAGAVLEGDLQNGPSVGVDNRGDSHLIVWDEDNNVVYEFYRASRPSENADGRWHADGEAVWDMKVNTFRTIGDTSADAAGLTILPGLVRPDEGLPTSEGGQGAINHAIRFTLQNAVILNQFIYPASHVANPGNTNSAIQPPMGARFRLKASVNISTLNPESQVVAQAMKDYGMIVADNGSNFFFSGASASVNANNQYALTWNDNDIQDSVHGLKSLHYSDFEVVDLTPIVTGLSTTSGSAGTSVTVVGKNFSGAAGHLQVFFGSAPATSVTVVDDSHVLVVAPTGSGTVDVRVQSGVGDPSDASNVKSPIFGYGTSTVSAADRFAYVVTPIPADFNLDGVVNLIDLNIFKANFGTGTTWATGDANGDGLVNLADLNIWKVNFGKSFFAPPVGAPAAGAGVPQQNDLTPPADPAATIPSKPIAVTPGGPAASFRAGVLAGNPAVKTPRGDGPLLSMVVPAIYMGAGPNRQSAFAGGIALLPNEGSHTSSTTVARAESASPSYQMNKSGISAVELFSNASLPAAARQAVHDAVFTGLEQGRVSMVDGLLGVRAADSDAGLVAAELDLGHVGTPRTSRLQP
jgi:hypothetical protein